MKQDIMVVLLLPIMFGIAAIFVPWIVSGIRRHDAELIESGRRKALEDINRIKNEVKP